MFKQEYLEQNYTIRPLPVPGDISLCALQQAYQMLDLPLSCILRLSVSSANSILGVCLPNELYNITYIIDEALPVDAWYLVDSKSKTIIYSPGF